MDRSAAFPAASSRGKRPEAARVKRGDTRSTGDRRDRQSKVLWDVEPPQGIWETAPSQDAASGAAGQRVDTSSLVAHARTVRAAMDQAPGITLANAAASEQAALKDDTLLVE
eukprot:4718736-Prymnesium_polylepis.1